MTPRQVRYVQPKVFERLTGYTEKAFERKRETGVWREGREYRKAPDGRYLIDLDGYEKWVSKGDSHGA
jgi:hypothetical protein